MRNKHFTERERYLIEFMRKNKYTVKQIAKEIGKSERAVYYELKRGKVQLINSDLTTRVEYCADTAQNDYNYKQTAKGSDLKLSNDYDFVKFIEHKIVKEKCSPYAALVFSSRENFKTNICLKTLYNYIHMGLFANITQHDLPYVKKKREYDEVRTVCTKNVNKPSIENRPKDILNRNDYGHWEMDTVYSGRNKSKECLLVLTERKYRDEIIIKMSDRTACSTVKALDQLYKCYGDESFRQIFKSITVDNGSEFADYEGMKKCNRTEIYYCHPYASSERASNENQNKLIRRWIKKGEDISLYSDQQIKDIENWINNYPRKMYNGLSVKQFMQNAQENNSDPALFLVH